MPASTRRSGERTRSARDPLRSKWASATRQLIRAALALFMLQVTAQGLAQDARVIMVTGDVHLVRDLGGTSTRSPLATGQDIRVGDLVATGGQGRAQLRFRDGPVVSTPPGTHFRTDE